MPRSEEALACRLFHEVKLQPKSGLLVHMESEFSCDQKQQLVKANAAGRAQQLNKSTFRDLSVRQFPGAVTTLRNQWSVVP